MLLSTSRCSTIWRRLEKHVYALMILYCIVLVAERVNINEAGLDLWTNNCLQNYIWRFQEQNNEEWNVSSAMMDNEIESLTFNLILLSLLTTEKAIMVTPSSDFKSELVCPLSLKYLWTQQPKGPIHLNQVCRRKGLMIKVMRLLSPSSSSCWKCTILTGCWATAMMAFP